MTAWQAINLRRNMYIKPDLVNGPGLACYLILGAFNFNSKVNLIRIEDLENDWWCVHSPSDWILDTDFFSCLYCPGPNYECIVAAVCSELYSGSGENIDFQKGDIFPFKDKLSELTKGRWVIFKP